MKSIRAWQRVRMRRVTIGGDPDAPPRALILPASWDDAAAAALAALAPGSGAASLAGVAEGWIRPLHDRAQRSGLAPLSDALHGLLRRRQAAPSAEIWAGPEAWVAEPAQAPGFVLNLASFYDASAGFDVACFESAIDTAVTALTLAAPGAAAIAVGMADLAGLLACLGVDYDSDAARALAACVAALLRGRADAASARLAGLFGTAPADAAEVPPPPPVCIVPGLAEAAAAAWNERPRTGLRHRETTAVARPGLAEALLGVETGGIAPAFSALSAHEGSAHGGLTRTARAGLAARGLTAEAALADLMAGVDHLAPVPAAAHVALRSCVAPYIQRLGPAPVVYATVPEVAARRRGALPARASGYAQRATVGGHTVLLRTGEYADGALGEVCITPHKESATVRGLMECFSQAVSMGLQHGVALGDYVDAFTQTAFGPAGAVEGDPAVDRATSLVDYVFRHLSVHYLGRSAPPLPREDAPVAAPAPATPLLPMNLPQDNRKRAGRLRLVAR